MKKISIAKFTAIVLVWAVFINLIPANELSAASDPDSFQLPVAGIARALNEGRSVTAIRADKVKKTGTAGVKYIMEVAAAASSSAEESKEKDAPGEGHQSVFSTVVYASEEEGQEPEPEAPQADFDDAIVVDPQERTDMEMDVISAGAGSSITDGEEEEKPSSTVSVDDIASINAGAESTIDTGDSDGSMNLVDAVTAKEHYDVEDFTNLVIARVNDYVNVRELPTEESEIVGKLYNKSVGDELEDAGDWVKIKSGNTVGYVKKEYVVRGDEAVALAPEVGTRMARVITTTLYVRHEPSLEAEVIGMVPMDDELTVSEETSDGWVKVSIEEGDGYVSGEFVRIYTDFVRAESRQEEEARLKKEAEEREAARRAAEAAQKKNQKKNSSGKKNGGSSGGGGGGYSASGSGTGASVANYALQFVGNPYVYGGTSLTNGADCSGFVMSVYRNFGISLPHSSGGDRAVGSAVPGGLANAQAGDIVCYSGHVGIYIGNGNIVHASTARTGIKVSNANYRNVLAVRRIF